MRRSDPTRRHASADIVVDRGGHPPPPATELFKSRRPDAVQGLSSTSSTARPRLQLVTGNANRELADEISARLGVPLTPAKIGKFADGEVSIQILENVRNSDVYIIQVKSH